MKAFEAEYSIILAFLNRCRLIPLDVKSSGSGLICLTYLMATKLSKHTHFESTEPTADLPTRQSSDAGRVFPSCVRVDKVPYGLGVFALALIEKETPIGRVSGKIIREEGYGSDYCISAGDDKVLEPGPPFCYLNHSCEPNCQLMQYVREEVAEGENIEVGELTADEMDIEDDLEEIDDDLFEDEDCFFGEGAAEIRDEMDCDCDECCKDGSEIDGGKEDDEPEMMFEDDEDAEIWVESLRDILPGEELTIDYAWPADRAAKCLCGTKKCRGWIVDPVEMEDLQKMIRSGEVEN